MESLILFLILCVPVAIYLYLRVRPNKPMLCVRCKTIASPKNAVKGSMAMELFLWICFIIPGLIYSIWRDQARYKKCSACGCSELIPPNSPRGKEVLEKANA
jgi:hypothetical protein